MPKANADRDKFAEPSSPFMPSSLHWWTTALNVVGENFDAALHAPAGVSRGYAVPDPSVLASVERDTTRAFMLTAYLKLRSVILYRLSSTLFEPLPPPVWRKVLTLELISSSKEGTKTSKMRDDAKANLIRCMVEGGLQGSVDLDNLRTAPTLWRTRSLEPNVLPPTPTIQQILWELYEINFRHELTTIDQQYYSLKNVGFDDPRPDDEPGQFVDYDELDASDYGQRKMKVLTAIPHFNGTIVPQDINDGSSGFASKSAEERQAALWGLYRIMRGWTKAAAGMSKKTHQLAAGLESGSLSDDDLGQIEYRLAWFYIDAYVSYFKRAPLTPHSL